MEKCLWVYTTHANEQAALEICEKLLAEKLIACGNLIPSATSLYWWEGEMKKDQEAVLILKTSANKYSQLENRIRELHSYDCPCIVALDINQGNPAFLRWITNQSE